MAESFLRASLDQAPRTSTDLGAEIKIAIFAIEGILTHDLGEPQQQAICRHLAASQ